MKLSDRKFSRPSDQVAPFTGVWIETICGYQDPQPGLVAPFTGVWIETVLAGSRVNIMSRRALHGRVD